MITVICPSHRPEALQRVVKLFAVQRHPTKRLVIVENGPAVGQCQRMGHQADAVLSSEENKSLAMCEGLTWLRLNGGGAWALWDDDDYYGPGYLDEVMLSLSGFDMSGKPSFYVRTPTRLVYVERLKRHPLGHSFAGWSDCPDPPHTAHYDDDDQWRKTMVGARWNARSARHFLWNRTKVEGHLYPTLENSMLSALQPDRLFSLPLGLPDKIVDMDMIPSGQQISVPVFDPVDCLPPEFRSRWLETS